MAVNHRKDSIQLIRDTEGINNKDRVRILSPGSSPPKETTEVTEHALYMEPKNTPSDGEPYEYEFACCTGRRFIPQRAGDANKLEGKTSAEVKALFADGRAVFAGSGTSVTLDAEGDRVHSIIVNGFTKQTGSGTPSPENQMPLTNGGLRMVEFVLKGTENFVMDSEGRLDLANGLPAKPKTTECVCNIVKYKYEYGGNGVFVQPTNNGLYFGTKYSKENGISSAAEWKAILAARYAAGKPVIVWYVPADESEATGIYIPIIGTGGKYSAKCVKITDKLCAGDKFISRALSGCDAWVVLTGAPSENWEINGGSGVGPSGSRRFHFTIRDVASAANQSNDTADGFYSNYLEPRTPNETYKSRFENTFSVIRDSGGGLDVEVRIEGISTVDGLKTKLSEDPLFVVYKTVNYDKRNDVSVAKEMHVKNLITMTGKEQFTRANSEDYQMKTAGQYPDSDATANGKCSHFKYEYYYKGNGVLVNQAGEMHIESGAAAKLDFTDPSEVSAYLTAQYEVGTPLQIEYVRKTPVVYVHEPVDFEFAPGEDGVFTITGEADGTLDVYYKALQDGGDADKLGGKLPEYYAAATNALGQYTHIKSGTVHELTGTGDNIRFVATADFAAGDTVKVNGTTCTASTMSGDALWAGFFKSGAVVVCYRTGNALNFSGGGLAAAEAAKITPENLKTGVSVTVNGKTVAGTFTADGTAAAGDMLLGKTGYVKGQKVTGTIPSKAAASYKPGTSAQTIKAVQYLSGDQTIEGDAALIAANIKYGASIFDVDGSFTSDANAVDAEILTGKIGYVKGQKITGSMPNRGAVSQWLGINGTYTIPAGYHNGQGVVKQSIPTKGEATYTPSTREQVIEKNQYLTGSQFIKGDGNLVAGNIRSGVSIFGVAGSFMEGSGGYLYMGQRNNTAMYGYAFGSASYSNGIRIGRSGNYLLVMFGYNETGATGRMKVNGSDVFAYGLNPAAVHTTTKWLNAGDIVTISADEGVNYALTGFVYNT